MHIFTRAQFNELVASLAKKHNKTQDEIRNLLTTGGLATMGYRAETLIEQIEREGVRARENMVIENLLAKGLI